MTADQTTDSSPVAAPQQGAGEGAVVAVEPIATLPPLVAGEGPNALIEVNPRTGEPRRPFSVRVAGVASYAAATGSIATLAITYAGCLTDFGRAALLFGWFAQPGVLAQVLLVAAATVIAVAVAAANIVTGYYAWFGYSWTRIAGLISAGVSLLLVLLNPIGWVSIGLAVVAGALLWLPRVDAFNTAWAQRRHPEIAFSDPAVGVFYGPLPRYRRL